jgi:hypothetical protein
VILLHMVGPLALNANIGLVVVGTDGISAEAAAAEIAAYLTRRHRKLPLPPVRDVISLPNAIDGPLPPSLAASR